MSEQTTTARCEHSGIYMTDCECAQMEAIVKGTPFPPCDQCGEVVTWTSFAHP